MLRRILRLTIAPPPAQCAGRRAYARADLRPLTCVVPNGTAYRTDTGPDSRTAQSAASASRRHRRFLEYIVEKAIQGRAEDLKGYTLAIEVFDRETDLNPQTDPIVQIEAGRLRRALERYYLTEGKNDPIGITIPGLWMFPAITAKGNLGVPCV